MAIEIDLRESYSPSAGLGMIAKAIMQREADRSPKPVRATWVLQDDPPTFQPVLPSIRHIIVSPWTNDELRRAAVQDACGREAIVQVDYCDGRGPRVQIMGIVAEIDPNIPDYIAALR